MAELVRTPDFYIGSIPIYGRLIQSPMDGISVPTFRWITRKLGSAYSVSEFINTLDYTVMRHYQENRLIFREEERPFGFQLLDNDAFRMAESAARLMAEFKPDFFDINIGCCTQRVTSRGAGAGLMRTPELVRQIFIEVGKAVNVPITAKIRLGMDEDHLNYREIAEIAVAHGAQGVALHGRTGKMGYSGKARWQPIAELKRLLPVPVIGNGDVTCVADAQRMFEETGCDAIMIGRASKENPWIFAWKDRSEIPPERVYALIQYQYSAMAAQIPPEYAIKAFRKYLKALIEPYQLSRDTLKGLLVCTEERTLLELINQVFIDLGVDINQDSDWSPNLTKN
ncbi:MAG: tRNA-dihydrouridine synthase family protein [Anaerolineaceae bacterium]